MSLALTAAPQNSTNVRLSWGPSFLARLGIRLAAGVAPDLAARWALDRFATPARHGPTPREREALATARPMDVASGGRRLRAWVWGDGPAILLVHGWGGRGAQLAPFAPPLVAAGFAAVALDGPAHGGSEGRRATLLDFRDAVRSAAVRFGPLRGVIAHSLGAAATALAMRDGLTVGRAVFVGPPADPMRYLRRFLAMLGAPATLAPLVEARLSAGAGLGPRDVHVPTAARAMATPLLVVHDRTDREVPWEDGLAIAAAWPGARLWTTEGLGHRKLLRDPDVVARAVAFVGSGRAAAPGARCATPGCSRPAAEPGPDGRGHCEPCVLEQELFDRDARWARVTPA
jgi:hypothetical protein